MSVRSSGSPLDADVFARLLARLHDQPEQAGLEYEGLRRTLLRFFEWRGVAAADEATDDALDRLGRRVADGEPIADLRAYALGIARLVALEHLRRPERHHAHLDAVVADRMASPPDGSSESPRLACFDGCFGALAPDLREFIVTYYAETGRTRIDARATLARGLALSPNALRLRAQRVRDRLEACIRHCQAGPVATRAEDLTP